MKIKTITCHDVYNYGASLQAYALQQYLLSLGHDVEIIDYKPDYLRVHYNFWYVPENSHYYRKAKKSRLFRFLVCCYFAPTRFATYGRKLQFDAFTRKCLHLTKIYLSYQDLIDNPPAADLYIAGSDQIWNCKLPNGKDPAFFLQFGDRGIKKISYAASFAIPQIPESQKMIMHDWLKSLDAISVREKTGLNILESFNIRGAVVLDPVFLLTKEEWYSFIQSGRIMKSRYILVYDLYPDDEHILHEARRLAVKYDLRIIAVDALSKCRYADKSISNAGPKEFVNLIANAEYVITNSFHATAFSLIFNRKFSVYYKYSNISRISDILSGVGLETQLNADSPNYNIDWDKVNVRLAEMKNESYKFIASNLG